MNVEDSFRRVGKVLQGDDGDFRVEVVRWRKENGREKTAVLKTMQGTILERRRSGFANESLGTEAFRALALEHPEWNLVVPRTYAESDTWSIRRFMRGEPLLREGTELTNLAETTRRLGKLAGLLAMIDQVEPDTSAPDDPWNSAPYDNMLVRMPQWAIRPMEDGLLSPDDLAATTDLITRNEQYLVPRYAHGDLMPYAHVLVRPDDRLAFIDFEHYSARKPRYYDVAYCYAQMFTKIATPSLAGYFMEEVLDKMEPVEHQTEQMMAVLAQRSIRLFFDASFAKLAKDHHKVERTQRLLDICHTGDLDTLVNPSAWRIAPL